MPSQSFDQPYSPGEVELTQSSSHPPNSDVNPPVLTNDPAASPALAPRVKWPQEMSRHVSVVMRNSQPSPQILTDEGGQHHLDLALAAHSSREDAEASEIIEDAEKERLGELTNSEGASTRVSSEVDEDERMELLRADIEIFVDPLETEGLPSASRKTAAERNKQDAWNLVRGYGAGGFLRSRKRKTQRADQAREKEEEEAHSKSKFGGDGEDYSVKMGEERNESMLGGGGILSSLMALQQQQQQHASGAATPGGGSTLSSRASSISGYSSGSDDEEAEREKFTNAQREKRRKGSWANPITKTMSGLTGGNKNAGGTDAQQATRRPLSHSSPRPPFANSPGAMTPPLHRTTSSTTDVDDKERFEEEPLERPGRPSMRPRPRSFMGDSTRQMKKLGEKSALDVESPKSRPEYTRAGSSSGHVTAAPTPQRPEYVSRSSAPLVPTLSSNSGPERPRSVFSRSRPVSPSREKDDFDTGSIGSSSGIKSRPASVSGPLIEKKKNGFSLHLNNLPVVPALLAGSTNALLAGPTALYKLGVGLGKVATNVARPGSNHGTPEEHAFGEYFMGHKETTEEREQREWEKEKRKRKKAKEKRKAEQVFIVAHVAAILSRQEFIMQLGRAFMMFGAPSHRLEAQMQATARVLEINCQVIYIPGVMLISFGDNATHTSEIKFLKQANGLDLGKLLAAYFVYWNVIHDKISVTEASIELDGLMTAPPKYKLWQHLVIGGLASAFIQPSAFYGSFIDCLVAIPLGSLLVFVQVVVSKNDLYSSLFEIAIACVNSFLAAALASTNQFCFAAVASGSVVLILPGYIVLCASLELANRSIISGSVRLVYSILYSLFLGFGLSMGAEVYSRITGLGIVGSTQYTCADLRLDAPWWRATISPWFFFLTAPGYLLLLGLRNGQPFYRRETIIMVLVGSAGWVCNYFSSKAFVGRPDISSAIGSFVVGLLGNVYGKISNSSAFVVMVVGVLFQLPSGLSNGGLLEFASASNVNGNGAPFTYSAGFSVASSLIQVAIGLTVGLFVSAAIVNSFGGGRRRGSNLSSF